MTELFSEGQIRELHEAFSLADKSGKGVIEGNNVGIVMRRLGHIVTDEEAEAMMDEISEEPKKITFADFLTLMANKMKQANTEEMVQEAFKVLDTDGEGLIRVEELERVLTGLGDRLSPREYQEMMTVMGLGVGDQISFSNFRNIIGDI
ncbi:unnamed protein product [Nezara viridula]|uniref:EF-hand domain-containing protein n=1 Tax=Nezara viridula TaxID=85310 RepID=A0A9P0MQ23_NEZVI|nr:unnamed protein product [Nezara viridula]